jgi:hypothetical protein
MGWDDLMGSRARGRGSDRAGAVDGAAAAKAAFEPAKELVTECFGTVLGGCELAGRSGLLAVDFCTLRSLQKSKKVRFKKQQQISGSKPS